MLSDQRSYCGFLQVSVFIPHAQSLKDKRMVLKSLKEKFRHDFNISVAEVGEADKWQTATLAFAMVSNDLRFLEESFADILRKMEENYPLQICEHDLRFL